MVFKLKQYFNQFEIQAIKSKDLKINIKIKKINYILKINKQKHKIYYTFSYS